MAGGRRGAGGRDGSYGRRLSHRTKPPRTIGSHLYRTFPKPGITARNQLRDLLDEAA
ncbi:hypothetical protein [Streptomyces sp. NPDC088923]|uniref:hypothetical protein n=1 Tax=Streptomyces sp. NPDC088923 TaxID=3365913 RepID=UPI00380362DE